jgi:aspartate ammonia-lyase
MAARRPRAATRTEQDSLGPKAIPADAYYGIQTYRAVENFPISGLRMPIEMVRAFGLIKEAAAMANRTVGELDARRAGAILKACNELLDGRFDDQFVVDVYQAGAGTSFNMNANEVLANRANELLGGKRGTYDRVHPNDHVNMAQSTNDTFPTAIRLACLMKRPRLLAAMGEVASALRAKGEEFRKIVKSGRTHLQDAVPVSLGREFLAYGLAIEKARARVEQAAEALTEVNLGGTAVGTGLNAPARYRELAIKQLNVRTTFGLRPAQDMQERMQSLADFAQLSGVLRGYSLELTRIANDIRLLCSGPSTALAEITLPAVQPGSSIMPGKVNPSVPEMVNQVAFQAIGHDATVALCTQAGQLELNVMMPVLSYNLLQMMHILSTSGEVFARRCIVGITANAERCRQLAQRSLSLVTSLAPKIGYQQAAKIAKESLQTGRTIEELVIAQELMPADEARRLLDPERLVRF